MCHFFEGVMNYNHIEISAASSKNKLCSGFPNTSGKHVHVVYTPLHPTSI